MSPLGGSHAWPDSLQLSAERAAGGWFSCSTCHCTTLNKVVTAQRCRLSPQLRASRHPPSDPAFPGAATIPRRCPHPICPGSPSEAIMPAQRTSMPGHHPPRPGLSHSWKRKPFFCCKIMNKIKLTLERINDTRWFHKM